MQVAPAPPRPRADPFGATPGKLSATLFGNLGLFTESAASVATRPGVSAEFHLGYGVTPELSLVGIGELGFVLQDTGQLVPITLAAAARAEHVGPVKLLGGAGFTLAPYLGAPASAPASSFAGLALLAEAVYPMPGTPLALKGRISLHPLSNVTLIVFTAGGGVAF